MASVSSVIPIAARWRVPNCLSVRLRFVRGRMQDAAETLPFWTITAPSWRGVPGKNMVSISSSVNSPSIPTPRSIYSISPPLPSSTSNVPWRRADSCSQDRTISLISGSVPPLVRRKKNGVLRPTCSRTRRISGWKITGIDTNITRELFRNSQLKAVNSTVRTRTKTSMPMIRIPSASCAAWVPRSRCNNA